MYGKFHGCVVSFTVVQVTNAAQGAMYNICLPTCFLEVRSSEPTLKPLPTDGLISTGSPCMSLFHSAWCTLA